MHAYTKTNSLSTVSCKRAFARLWFLSAAVLFCALFAGCGATSQPKASLESGDPALVLWPRAEKAVLLHFMADRALNTYDSKSHSIQVCVYQLDKPDAFQELAKTQEGVTTLLKAEPFDASVKNVVRLFVQPLEDISVALDRQEEATFVGIVCGYFESAPEDAAKVWKIPFEETTTGSLFWKSTTYSAGILDIRLRLTSRAMVESSGQTREQ